MKPALRAAIALLALSTALPACARTTPVRHGANDADPALWVVRGKTATVYLFGTIHVLKPGLSWFDEAVKAAFDRSDQVVLELVMPDAATMQGIVKATGLTSGGPTLTEQLPPEKRTAYAKAVIGLGLPANALDQYKPWLAATTLSITPLEKLGYDPANGPEHVITAAATAAHKPVIGLETAEQQLGYFGGLSQKAQVQFLVSTLDELPTVGPQMAKMVDEWAHGRTEALAADMNDDLKDSPEIEQTLLVNRNRNWAQWIKARMAKPGTVFIAVGAGHLAGKDSVQAQLAKLGLKAKRVNY